MHSPEIMTLVYDGECPICELGARKYLLDPKHGAIKTVNARDARDNLIMNDIARAGMDLDQGMVVQYRDKLYHGADAMKLLASMGANRSRGEGLQNYILRSNFAGVILYPVFKIFRRLALFAKGIRLINQVKNP